MTRILFLFVLIGVVAPGVLFAQEQPAGEIPVMHAPDTLEEAKEQSLNIGGKIAGILPGVVANIWTTQVLPVWRDMWSWTYQELWQKRAQPTAQNLFDKGMQLLGREVEQRRPIIEQELEQEKQELQEDIQQHGENIKKSLWERFKDLFRKD